ncbi:uncharacterized protein LOC133708207 isoform X3 [Rosa rugosa]|uniref:uncharacterized protein LOC133708207 isoform X3 n=1 Tax=Rosa rugosa TaxID=74645 RepID=UPI002B40D898|nr:uncharacterized protein LOC133708207 isoform X3 [Rosa rugosa]
MESEFCGLCLSLGDRCVILYIWLKLPPMDYCNGDQLEHELGFALLPSQIGGVQQLLLHGKWSNTLYALFWSYFAAIRGVNPVVQPLIDLNMNVLVYNGEIFGGIEIASEENDGEVLMGLLGGCESCVPNVVSRIKGPWAIIYWQGLLCRLEYRVIVIEAEVDFQSRGCRRALILVVFRCVVSW